jgi:hypothetical protein
MALRHDRAPLRVKLLRHLPHFRQLVRHAGGEIATRDDRRLVGRSVGAGTAMLESYDLGEDGTERRGATIADALGDAPFEPGDLTSRERSEPVSSTREVDAHGAGILGIQPPFHEPGAFDDTNHRGHRLLGEV